jgi:ABC-type lipoprotein export system ATPase subunit
MLISVKNITKSFGSKQEGNLQLVLDNVDFRMEEGESVAILGPSGSGKTTFLNILGTLDQPDNGAVNFKGKNILELKNNEVDNFRASEIGFVFQFHHLLPQCTALENVLIPTLALRDEKKKKQKEVLAEELLNRLGLWEHRDKFPSKLSGGECQRVAVVRAMINQPSLLLADEPTGALDHENAEKIADLLTDLNSQDNLSLLVVTHSEELAKKMKTVYQLIDGKLKLKSSE